MTIYEVPLSPKPQTLSIALGAIVYNLRVRWNTFTNCWIIDILDSNFLSIVCGIPLVTGVDLLGQYAYLGIGGQLVVFTDFDLTAAPTYANLGINGHLTFVTS